jgi:hypothetical protein
MTIEFYKIQFVPANPNSHKPDTTWTKSCFERFVTVWISGEKLYWHVHFQTKCTSNLKIFIFLNNLRTQGTGTQVTHKIKFPNLGNEDS